MDVKQQKICLRAVRLLELLDASRIGFVESCLLGHRRCRLLHVQSLELLLATGKGEGATKQERERTAVRQRAKKRRPVR